MKSIPGYLWTLVLFVAALSVGHLNHDKSIKALESRIECLERNALQFTTNAPPAMMTIPGPQTQRHR